MRQHRSASLPERILQRRIVQGKYQFDEFGQLEKRCSICGEFWPADTEFFYAQTDKCDGLKSSCRACNFERLQARGFTLSGSRKPKYLAASAVNN